MYFSFDSHVLLKQRYIECLEGEVKQKSKDTDNLAMTLEEKNEEIFQLKQKISSQEKKLQEQEISLDQKSFLLNILITLVQELYRARDEK